MFTIANALIPIFFVIAIGYFLRTIRFAPEEAWRLVERIVYFVLFPALLMHTIAEADFSSFEILPLAVALLAMLGVVILFLTFLRRTIGARIGLVGAAYSSVFQGSLRWNGFVALAAVGALRGNEGIAIAALAIAVLVPTLNVLSVMILARHANQSSSDWRTILRIISRNPLILGALAGVILNVTEIGLPGPLLPTMQLMGRAALTLGLLAVGAGLDLRAVRDIKGLVFLACGLKLIATPFLVYFFCLALQIEGLPREVAIMCATVPTASSSYILARQLGGDANLMAAIITATTLVAIVSMPVMITILS